MNIPSQHLLRSSINICKIASHVRLHLQNFVNMRSLAPTVMNARPLIFVSRTIQPCSGFKCPPAITQCPSSISVIVTGFRRGGIALKHKRCNLGPRCGCALVYGCAHAAVNAQNIGVEDVFQLVVFVVASQSASCFRCGFVFKQMALDRRRPLQSAAHTRCCAYHTRFCASRLPPPFTSCASAF